MSKKVKTPLLLVDGDILVYRALASSEFEHCWDPEGDGVIWSLWTNLDKAADVFQSQLDKVLHQFDYKELLVALTGSGNFRKALWNGYKGNRSDTRKPVGFLEFRKRLQEREDIKVVEYDGIEADDVLGILATKPGNESAVMVSDDKDLFTIPGKLFQQGQLHVTSVKEADLFHLEQTLTGDTTDGYKGCPGTGKVKAHKILEAPGDTWVNIVKAYEKAELTEADALMNARMARILRWSDWDSEKREPILWSPKA